MSYESIPILRGYYDGTWYVLDCPFCGEPLLHVEMVTAEARHEDAPITDISVNLMTAEVTSERTAKRTGTSFRRQSVTLHFYCEDCITIGTISFAQHKGATLVEIHRTGEVEYTDHGMVDPW